MTCRQCVDESVTTTIVFVHFLAAYTIHSQNSNMRLVTLLVPLSAELVTRSRDTCQELDSFDCATDDECGTGNWCEDTENSNIAKHCRQFVGPVELLNEHTCEGGIHFVT